MNPPAVLAPRSLEAQQMPQSDSKEAVSLSTQKNPKKSARGVSVTQLDRAQGKKLLGV